MLQGGGAMGAYQGGVYEALHEAGIEPDWVIDTSIGAIDAALIVGNAWLVDSLDRHERRRSGFAGLLCPHCPAWLSPCLPLAEDAICASQTFRPCVGIDPSHEAAPAATTPLKFRRLLEQHRARAMPLQLSGGEQQRVAIARGLESEFSDVQPSLDSL